MNTKTCRHRNAPIDPSHLPWDERAWVADWQDFVVVNFAVPPRSLAPLVPYPLDVRDGAAWVSLVWFNLSRLRFAGTGWLGRCLCRPLSEHPFLNVRTYVRPAQGPGICFLAEWIPNRWSVLLGPATYGLPYRYGAFAAERRLLQGTMSLRIDDPDTSGGSFGLTVPIPRATREECAPGSIDEFLLERYQAYMFHANEPRRFHVAHQRWRAVRADWVRFELGFLTTIFPWLNLATFHSAHLSQGCADVEMGRPHRVRLPAPAPVDVLPPAHPLATPAL
jgi:uncharacterized protein YqjF (DUF2071 family)